MFRYIFVRKICGYLRERSGFAAICVGIFVPVLNDREWARLPAGQFRASSLAGKAPSIPGSTPASTKGAGRV